MFIILFSARVFAENNIIPQRKKRFSDTKKVFVLKNRVVILLAIFVILVKASTYHLYFFLIKSHERSRASCFFHTHLYSTCCILYTNRREVFETSFFLRKCSWENYLRGFTMSSSEERLLKFQVVLWRSPTLNPVTLAP